MARDARNDLDATVLVDGKPVWELPLIEFIEAASKGRYKRPYHFKEICDAIEAAERLTNARDVFAAPVQHGKTTLIEFAIAWILLRHRDRAIIYITYAQRKAEKHSRRIRAIYLACGGTLKADFNTIQQWQTEEGGGLLVTSRDGEITGNDAVHIFFDDPYKDRSEAENVETRDALEEKYSGEIVTRIAPSGSIQIIASRWHVEDLSGTRIRDGYNHVHLKAITLVPTLDEYGEPETDDHGNPVVHEVALCPDGPDPRYPRTLEFLRSIRDGKDVTSYDWSSLFQGDPKPPSGGLFQNARLIESKDLSGLGLRGIGADLAYSVGGDRIALVGTALSDAGDLVVLRVQTWQRSALENLPLIRAFIDDFVVDEIMPDIASYMAGVEIGVAKALARIEDEHGGPIRIRVMPAKYNKIVRAGRTSRRWNAGGILVLAGQEWTADFIRRVVGFTGLDGDRDDEVDALVSIHDLRFVGAGLKTPDGGFKRGKRVM